MTYGELDLLTEERNAWQRGDYPRAEALALAIAAEEDITRADNLQGITDAIRERITAANWRTGKKAELRELIEGILNDLDGGAS
jgi:hypothetical protein